MQSTPPDLRRRRRTRLVISAVTAAAVVGGTIITTAMTASAATVDTNAAYVLVNHHSGKALDLWNWSTDNGAPVNQWARNDLAVQQWQFVDAGSGYYKVKSKHSGKILELPDANDGTQLVQNSDSGNTRQHFKLVDSADGYVRLQNRHSNKVLDIWEWSTADGGKVVGFTNLDGWNQQWKLVKVGSGTTPTTPGGGGGGNPSTSWPSSAGSVSVSGTIKVSGTLDGGMKTYCCIGDGGQSESQDPMFELADGATIKNVIIGSPAGDGIHCKGRCTIQNVWWNDIGEDAATFQGTTGGTSYVIGGGARNGSDKTFQHNGDGTVNISGFYLRGSGKLYRACGNCSSSHQRHVVIDNVIVDDVDYVAGINSNWGDTARISRVTVYNSSSIHVCAKYKGVAKGSEPSYLGDGWNDSNCIVNKSDVTYR